MNTTESQFIALKYEISYVGIAVVLLSHLRTPHFHKEKNFILSSKAPQASVCIPDCIDQHNQN